MRENEATPLTNRISRTPKIQNATCEAHGDYESRNIFGGVWTQCPTCVKADDDQKEAERVNAEHNKQLARWEAKIGGAGIPDRFRSRTLDTFVATLQPQQTALNFAIDYAENFNTVLNTGRCALFVGKFGTGKTHLAAGIALAIMQKGHSALFLTVMRAIRRVKDTWHRNSSETESEAVAALVFPDLLILDEVGVQFGSDTEKRILFDVLNERYEKRRPTLLLSNLTEEGVTAFLGERITDRLKEDGGLLIPFGWESWRGQKF